MMVPGLERAEGSVEIDINVEGTVADPLVAVDVALCGVTMQSDWFPHPIEDLHGVATVSADGTQFRAMSPTGRDADWIARAPELSGCLPELTRLDGRQAVVGDGDVRSEGGFDASGWSPTRYSLGVEARDVRVQYLDFLPPMVGDGVLQLTILVT